MFTSSIDYVCPHLFLFKRLFAIDFSPLSSFPEDDDIRLMFVFGAWRAFLSVRLHKCDHTRSIIKIVIVHWMRIHCAYDDFITFNNIVDDRWGSPNERRKGEPEGLLLYMTQKKEKKNISYFIPFKWIILRKRN